MTTPPKLTLEQYLAFLDCLPVHPSQFYFALMDDNMEGAREILRKSPNLDFNWRGEDGHTAFSIACGHGRYDIVSILLAHPDINVNVKDNSGRTPFYFACANGHTSCVRELLKDSRVKVNEPDDDGSTPLWLAAWNGHIDIIKWWIASGREIDLGTPGDIDKTDAIGAAKDAGKTEVVTLLERFQESPNETRHQVRLEIEWYNEAAAEMFALVVFVSDGFLQINETTTPAARFFSIARRLPLELQMIICHLVMGSPKEIISGKDSEVAFKSLTKRLAWSS